MKVFFPFRFDCESVSLVRNTLLIGFCEHIGLIVGLVLAAMVAALRLGL
jgi:hypothetical protein